MYSHCVVNAYQASKSDATKKEKKIEEEDEIQWFFPVVQLCRCNHKPAQNGPLKHNLELLT